MKSNRKQNGGGRRSNGSLGAAAALVYRSGGGQRCRFVGSFSECLGRLVRSRGVWFAGMVGRELLDAMADDLLSFYRGGGK